MVQTLRRKDLGPEVQAEVIVELAFLTSAAVPAGQPVDSPDPHSLTAGPVPGTGTISLEENGMEVEVEIDQGPIHQRNIVHNLDGVLT